MKCTIIILSVSGATRIISDEKSLNAKSNCKKTSIISCFVFILQYIYLPKAKLPLSEKRTKKLKPNINGISGPEWWASLFADIDKSPFYSGKDGKWAGMDFDWAVMNCEKLRGKLDRAISPKGHSSIGGKYDGIGTTFDNPD